MQLALPPGLEKIEFSTAGIEIRTASSLSSLSDLGAVHYRETPDLESEALSFSHDLAIS